MTTPPLQPTPAPLPASPLHGSPTTPSENLEEFTDPLAGLFEEFASYSDETKQVTTQPAPDAFQFNSPSPTSPTVQPSSPIQPQIPTNPHETPVILAEPPQSSNIPPAPSVELTTPIHPPPPILAVGPIPTTPTTEVTPNLPTFQEDNPSTSSGAPEFRSTKLKLPKRRTVSGTKQAPQRPPRPEPTQPSTPSPPQETSQEALPSYNQRKVIKNKPTTPAKIASTELTEEQKDKQQRIQAKATDLPNQNYYQLLEVDQSATTALIRKNYYRLSREFHPDSVAGTPLEALKNDLDQIFSSMNEAYSILSKKEKRTEYDKEVVLDSETAQLKKNATQAAQAEVFFTKAVVFLKKRDYAAAMNELQWACQLMPDEGDYQATYAWALYNDATNKQSVLADVQQRLQQARSGSQASEKAELYSGFLAKKQGDSSGALAHFEAVLQINPRNAKAKREVRYLSIQSGKPASKSRLRKQK